MEKRISPTKFLFGDDKIEAKSDFIYEVTLYEHSKNFIRLLDSCYYKSNKLLKLKNKIIIKRYKNRYLIKSINMIGAPLEFIKENNLKQL